MVAAASVITSRGVKTIPKTEGGILPWQEEAWRFYDEVGEFRFGVNWQANGLSRVNLVAARPPKQVGDEPSPINVDDPDTTFAEKRAAELISFIAGGSSGQGQLMSAFGQHLSVSGLGYLIAEPDLEDPLADSYDTWNVYSQDSVRFMGTGDQRWVEIRQGVGMSQDAWRRVHDNALTVKCWRKHPRRWWEPDAPVRGVLGVLEQIDLLGAHITATGRSRLAGAGLLAIPSEAEFPAPPDLSDGTPSTMDGFDYFVDQLTEAMTVPIKNRDSASGVVPLTISIPGEYIEKLQHISFATPFDAKITELLNEAIKRLALGLDMPPEVLTGMAGVNHWTAWQVEDTAITLHIEPNAEIVCHALTEGYLSPALQGENIDPGTAMVWYDTSDLSSPPDRHGNAVAVWDRLQLSSAALRRESGFGDEDKPEPDEFRQRVLLDVAKGAPTLAPDMLAEAGLMDRKVAAVVEDVRTDTTQPAVPAPSPAPEQPVQGPPPEEDRPGNAAILGTCDGIVYRAMERAGARLRSGIGRKIDGGPQAITHHEATTLHTIYDPTVYADLDHLLGGAFERVPAVAALLDVDPGMLEDTLNAYCRSLLAAQHEHTLDRLSAALGLDHVGV